MTARVSDEHGPILHWACGNDKVKIVEEVLNIGTELDKTNHKAFTPLKIACKRAYDEIAELLLKAGANPDFIGKSVGFTS
ncbi:ankyrin repeat domain-containing protein, partial [Salmonella sp. s51228]|uniref:ankyrin repeat domain-containing protein n=1 Tax=Salmonella sp. s51228 TaxID=3159652 RepID=UPI00397EA859